MNTTRVWIRCAAVPAVLVLICSCSMFRGKEKPRITTTSVEAAAVSTGENHEAKLRALVRDYIKSGSAGEEAGNARFVRAHPYYFKEYEVYPGGADSCQINVRETDSRTAPYAAEVKLAKQRFATKFQRKRSDAEADTNFLRSTGTETLSYELKNSRWTKVGSLFVAEKVEEKVNGEWVPLKEEVKKTIATESENQGFFGRLWSSLFGR